MNTYKIKREKRQKEVLVKLDFSDLHADEVPAACMTDSGTGILNCLALSPLSKELAEKTGWGTPGHLVLVRVKNILRAENIRFFEFCTEPQDYGLVLMDSDLRFEPTECDKIFTVSRVISGESYTSLKV